MSEPNRIIAPTLLPVFRIWVIGLVALVAISPTDIPANYRLYLALVYALLFFYPVFGSRYDRMSAAAPIHYDAIRFRWTAPLLAIQFVCISVATQYYTGSSFISAFGAALAGQNTYGDYQAYFAEAQIAYSPLISRVGYIAMLALGKVIVVFSVVNFFLGQRYRLGGVIFMATSCVMYLGFGLARGTFFEVFEVACAIFYFWFMTSTTRRAGKVGRRKTVLYVAAVGAIVLVGLFVLNAMRRYEDASLFFQQCSPNFCYVPWGMGDLIGYPTYLLTVYFGNGGYFIASLFDATITHGEAAYLIPMQSVISAWGGDEFGVRAFMCERYVSCRFVWTPEVATVISIFGILAIPATNALITYLGKFENYVIRNFNLPGMLLLFFGFMLVVSMPSANFFTISSPSIVATVVLIGVVFWQRQTRTRKRRRGHA